MQQAIGSRVMRNLFLTFSVINAVAVVAFVILLFFAPVASELSARARFTELDRAGVINAQALKQFHPSYRFGNVALLEYRRNVPAYLVASAVNVQSFNAALGLVVASINSIVWSWVWWRHSATRQPGPERSN
jgi:hypothetical protein